MVSITVAMWCVVVLASVMCTNFVTAQQGNILIMSPQAGTVWEGRVGHTASIEVDADGPVGLFVALDKNVLFARNPAEIALPQDRLGDGKHELCAWIEDKSGKQPETTCVIFFIALQDRISPGASDSASERRRKFGRKADQDSWSDTMRAGVVEIRPVSDIEKKDEEIHDSTAFLREDENAVNALRTVVEQYMMETIVDANAGAPQWAAAALADASDVHYLGVDAVSSVVEKNEKTFAGHRRFSFYEHDMTSGPLPKSVIGNGVDLIVTRGTLQLLPPGDVSRFIASVNASSASYWLASTWLDSNWNLHSNADTLCAPYNLLETPFDLPSPMRIFEDLPQGHPHCRRADEGRSHLALWKLPFTTSANAADLTGAAMTCSASGGADGVQACEARETALKTAALAPSFERPCSIIVAHPSDEPTMRMVPSGDATKPCPAFRVLYAYEAAAEAAEARRRQTKQTTPYLPTRDEDNARGDYAIVTGATSLEYLSNFLPSVLSFLCYARAHKYHVYVGIADRTLLGRRNVQYVKIPALRAVLTHHHGAMWLDLDTWFNLPLALDTPLTHYFEGAGRGDAHLAVLDGSLRHGTLFPNNGVFILRRSPDGWTKAFLKDWWEGSADGVHWDQTTFQHAILWAVARSMRNGDGGSATFAYDGQCAGRYTVTNRNACFIDVMEKNKMRPPYDRSDFTPEIHFVPAVYEPVLQWWNGIQTDDRPVFVYHSGNSDGKGYDIVRTMFPIHTC